MDGLLLKIHQLRDRLSARSESSGVHRTQQLRELADAMHLPGAGRSVAGLMHALRGALSPRHLIIVDEAHLALDRQQGADAPDVVRRLSDLTGCAVVLIFTTWDGQEVVKKSSYGGQLEQVVRRGLKEELPPTPKVGDISAIWQAYGLGEPDEESARKRKKYPVS